MQSALAPSTEEPFLLFAMTNLESEAVLNFFLSPLKVKLYFTTVSPQITPQIIQLLRSPLSRVLEIEDRCFF